MVRCEDCDFYRKSITCTGGCAGCYDQSNFKPYRDRPWHPCSYSDMELIHDGTWEDGKWYEWLDIYDNREEARMKKDAEDHFWPPTKKIKEQNVIAFRLL